MLLTAEFFYSIAPGMDADIVIWERHPLRLGARPDHVIVDGIKQQFNGSFDIPPNVLSSLNLGSPSDAKKDTRKDRAPIVNGDSLKLEDHGSKNPVTFTEACSPNTDSFVLRNIGKLFLAKNTVYDNTKALRKEDELYVIVENGTIVCSGAGCGRDKIDWPNKSAVFDLNGGYVLPVCGFFRLGGSFTWINQLTFPLRGSVSTFLGIDFNWCTNWSR